MNKVLIYLVIAFPTFFFAEANAQTTIVNFSASTVSSSVNFSWSPPPQNIDCNGDPCTFYKYMIQRHDLGNFIHISTNRLTNSFLMTDLPIGTHTFTLRAYYRISGDDYHNITSYPLTVSVGYHRIRYEYNALGRLVGVIDNDQILQSYRYDKSGNRCSSSKRAIDKYSNCE